MKETSKSRPWVRRVLKWLGVLAALAVVGMLVDGWRAFGRRADGARKARMERSPQWKGGKFENPQPLRNDFWLMMRGMMNVSPHATPSTPLPTVAVDPARFQTPPESGLRVTWLGHSTMLVEIDGHRVLTDPVWAERASPFGWIGPKRWYAPLIALDALPPIDVVVISHDHFDHLDDATISAMKGWGTTFVVPLGIGADLAYWGIPEDRIVELDWWERTKVRGLEVVCTPARHASGRAVFDSGQNLWGGFAFLGDRNRVYYSGDTGLFPAMKEIGERLGPFDLTMLETGAYYKAWPDWHMGPEQAVVAHQMVQGKVMLPVHWGLFNLAFHGWTEPVERVLAAAGRAGVTVATPKPGQAFEPTALGELGRWWPDLPWETAEQSPVVSSHVSFEAPVPALP
ncbi:MBL fold metallo-hydrolase [Chondromyces crocatus]|uniref:Membrane protein n=1 Tax=Chondromyces crocatus TaxID=52 RepID=A0A0K1ED74_CHOCO|nr:MBL fold metallo-hydrolase [Chondromyces crocatus]AKT38825.1 membrane protein [Chondromyces crocatus]